MPILRISEIRSMSLDERKKKLDDLQADLVQLRTVVKTGGSTENPHRIQEIRKTIARILTVNREEKNRIDK
jgi:large subunit ribosomal protein L29